MTFVTEAGVNLAVVVKVYEVAPDANEIGVRITPHPLDVLIELVAGHSQFSRSE